MKLAWPVMKDVVPKRQQMSIGNAFFSHCVRIGNRSEIRVIESGMLKDCVRRRHERILLRYWNGVAVTVWRRRYFGASRRHEPRSHIWMERNVTIRPRISHTRHIRYIQITVYMCRLQVLPFPSPHHKDTLPQIKTPKILLHLGESEKKSTDAVNL